MAQRYASRSSLTIKFFLCLCLIGGIPLLIVSLVSLSSVSNTLVMEALNQENRLLEGHRQQLELIQAQVESVAQSLSAVEDIIDTLSHSRVDASGFQRPATEQRIGRVLDGYLNLQGLVSIQLFGANGSYYQVGDTLGYRDRGLKDLYFFESLNSDGYLFWPGITINSNRHSAERYVVPAARLFLPMGSSELERKTSSGLIINYSARFLSHYLNPQRDRAIEPSRGVMLIDQNNRYIAHPNSARLGQPVDDPIRTALIGDTGQSLIELGPIPVYLTQLGSGSNGWKLVSVVSQAQVLAATEPVRNQLVALFVLSLVMTVWVAFHLSSSVVQPIRRITQAFGQLRDGHEQPLQRLVVQGNDEVAELTEGFNRVLDELEIRQRAQAALWQAATVFEVTNEAIMITDINGTIRMVNPAFENTTGYGADEAVGQPVSILRSRRHSAQFYQAIRTQLHETGQWQGEIYNRRKNGEEFPEWQIITAVQDESGRVSEYVSLFSDISERKSQEQMIWTQANYDSLTGLANRKMLKDSMVLALAHARRLHCKLALLSIDLDRFKSVNDTLGHELGDQLLVEVAHRIQMTVRKQDMVARMGGDEFTVVLSEVNDKEIMTTVAKKLLDVLQQSFLLDGRQIHISGSVGVTLFPDDGDDFTLLLKNADIALHKAKQAGKNRFQFYCDEMQAESLRRVQLEQDLWGAIDNADFVLLYQPIISAQDDCVVGAEALVRWVDPDRGLIQPDEFIAIAEDSGLMVEVGAWVLREAVGQLQRWQQMGLGHLRLAVNVSGTQFCHSDFSNWLEQLLQQSAINRECLVLEITESVLMESHDPVQAGIARTKATGVRFALDDFGTGYSSLGYLKSFPVDSVKIDRSFVRDCPDDVNDSRLVEAIIQMAHSLGLQVTAEGVETAAQQAFLCRLGCDFLQGFHIGHPLPVERFNERIHRPPPLSKQQPLQ